MIRKYSEKDRDRVFGGNWQAGGGVPPSGDLRVGAAPSRWGQSGGCAAGDWQQPATVSSVGENRAMNWRGGRF